MTARVLLSAALSEWTGGAADVRISGETIAAVLRALTDQHPGLGSLVWGSGNQSSPMLVTFLNGEDVRQLQGLATKVADGDEIMLVTAVEGGISRI